jgi:hypothetical protein
MKLIATILFALALTGCATGQYEAYTAATTAQAVATANAQAERYKALATLANSGSDVAKVAAVMALAGHGTGSTQQAAPIAAPRSPGDTALQWASLLVPTLGQAYMIGTNARLGMRQSDNATRLGMAQAEYNRDTQVGTANAFGGIASSGFNALASSNAANSTALMGVATAGFGTASTIAGAGFGTASTIAGTGFKAIETTTAGFIDLAKTNTAAVVSVSNSGLTSAAAIASNIQAPAANVTTTLSGAGVIGSGSYSIGPNSGTNSGNSGRLAGTSITDNTHTPVIVTQPAPVIVRPEVIQPTTPVAPATTP